MYTLDIKENHLILASASPRRKQLLEQMGLKFEIVVPSVPEDVVPGAAPADEAKRIAREKAAAVSAKRPDSWALAADTMVVIDGQILGKPADRDDAVRMLTMIAGRTHTVVTGYCLMRGGKTMKLGHVESRVRIRSLTEKHIRAYVATGEPMDKAGAYAAQGIGAFMIESIDGSYSNVVGLPLTETVNALEGCGVIHLEI